MYKVFPTGMIRIPLQKQEFYNKDYEDLINDKVFMEQLLVASPSLYDSVIDFDKCNEKKKQNVKVSLNSYSKRAAFRTTPFGIFTAINTVDLTKGTTSNVQKVSFIKKAVPDYSWIYSLVKSYEISNLEKLSLKINTAAFTQGDRYVLPFTVNESEEDRNISFSKPIKLLVEKCKTRYIKYEELIDVFKNNYPDIVSDMLESYIHDLVTNDFLISDLRPPICNINSLDYLLSKLEEGTLCTDLTTLKKMIEDYNDLNIGEGRDLLLQIFDKMESIYKYDNGGNYLKVDSLAEYEGDFNILSETARESIERLAEMFVKLNTNVKRRGGRKNSLEEYQLKFIGKYGENCSIPFVEVINKDAGIGFPEYYKGGEGEAIELSDPIMQMFEKKYEEALLNGGHIEFYSKDLDDFQTDQSNSLDSFELNFNIKIITMLGVSESTILPLLNKVGLGNIDKRPVKQFSLGMKQRLGIAISLINSPKLLILDEPTNGLDPIGIQELREIIESFKSEGMTIMISSHILSEVEHLADFIGFIYEGKIILEKEYDGSENLEELFNNQILFEKRR